MERNNSPSEDNSPTPSDYIVSSSTASSSSPPIIISSLLNPNDDTGKKEKEIMDEIIHLKDSIVSFRTEQGDLVIYPLFERLTAILKNKYNSFQDNLTPLNFEDTRSQYQLVTSLLTDSSDFMYTILEDYLYSRNQRFVIIALEILCYLGPSFPDDTLHDDRFHEFILKAITDSQPPIQTFALGLAPYLLFEREIIDRIISTQIPSVCLKRFRFLVEELKGTEIRARFSPPLASTSAVNEDSSRRLESPFKRKRHYATPDRGNIDDSGAPRSSRPIKRLRGVISPVKRLHYGTEDVVPNKNTWDLRISFNDLTGTRKELIWLIPLIAHIVDYAEITKICVDEETLENVMFLLNPKGSFRVDRFTLSLSLDALSSLLIHKSFGLEFIQQNGIQILLSLPRSIYFSDHIATVLSTLVQPSPVMQFLCLQPRCILSRLMDYALWLMSGQIGVSEAAYFFGISLSYPSFLEVFDEHDGLRGLINVISCYVSNPESGTDQREDARFAALALRQYFCSHIFLLTENLKRKLGQDTSPRHNNKQCPIDYKSIIGSVKTLISGNYCEVLEYLEPQNSQSWSSWGPIDRFMELNGMSVLSRLAYKLEKADIISTCFDVIHAVTLCPYTHLELVHEIPEITVDNIVFSPLTCLLHVITSSNTTFQEAKTSALQILSNITDRNPIKLRKQFFISESLPKISLMEGDQILAIVAESLRQKDCISILIEVLRGLSATVADMENMKFLAIRCMYGLSQFNTIRILLCRLDLSRLLSELVVVPSYELYSQNNHRLQKSVLELLQRLSERQIEISQQVINDISDPTMSKIEKSAIVSESHFHFSDSELLTLIYRHLKAKGFSEAAKVLQTEAQIGTDKIVSNALPPTASLPSKYHLKIDHAFTPVTFLSDQKTILGSTETPLKKEAELFSLESIITQYLRDQHSHCTKPVSVLPSFSLLEPHKCPTTTSLRPSHLNYSLHSRSINPRNNFPNTLEKKIIYKHFKPVRSIRDNSFFTCAKFFHDDANFLLGDYSGEIRVCDIYGGVTDIFKVGDQPLWSLDIHPQDRFLVSCSPYGGCKVFTKNGSEEPLYTFTEPIMSISSSGSILVGTDKKKCTLFSAETGASFMDFSRLHASLDSPRQIWQSGIGELNFDEELLYYDSTLWDLRSGKIVHSFDKFSDLGMGTFHPRNPELIINSEIWDLRMNTLLKTVPLIDKCAVEFNSSGSILYSIQPRTSATNQESKWPFPSANSFRTFDTDTYSPIKLVELQRTIYNIAIQPSENFLAIIESPNSNPRLSNFQDSFCRLYEIGRKPPTQDDIDYDDCELTDSEDIFDDEASEQNSSSSSDTTVNFDSDDADDTVESSDLDSEAEDDLMEQGSFEDGVEDFEDEDMSSNEVNSDSSSRSNEVEESEIEGEDEEDDDESEDSDFEPTEVAGDSDIDCSTSSTETL